MQGLTFGLYIVDKGKGIEPYGNQAFITSFSDYGQAKDGKRRWMRELRFDERSDKEIAIVLQTRCCACNQGLPIDEAFLQFLKEEGVHIESIPEVSRAIVDCINS